MVEGCYADLLALVIPRSTELIFLDLSVENCIKNCRNRAWEPHKYESSEAQEANLATLIDWVKQYHSRTDEFSRHAHVQLYENFGGQKFRFRTNDHGHVIKN